jgi:hypothetical protein
MTSERSHPGKSVDRNGSAMVTLDNEDGPARRRLAGFRSFLF